jgi:hypothetical protein
VSAKTPVDVAEVILDSPGGMTISTLAGDPTCIETW